MASIPINDEIMGAIWHDELIGLKYDLNQYKVYKDNQVIGYIKQMDMDYSAIPASAKIAWSGLPGPIGVVNRMAATVNTATTTTGYWSYEPSVWRSSDTVSTAFEWQINPTEQISYVYSNATSTWVLKTQKSPSDRLKEIIRSRVAPTGIVKSNSLSRTIDVREERARETLRRVIGDSKFRDFIRKGHVTVRGKSGLHYQIFPSHGITCVFRKGEMVERLCVVFDGAFPPTDSVIMRYLLILNNEDQFRALANKHAVNNPVFKNCVFPATPSPKSLVQIYQEITGKKAA